MVYHFAQNCLPIMTFLADIAFVMSNFYDTQ